MAQGGALRATRCEVCPTRRTLGPGGVTGAVRWPLESTGAFISLKVSTWGWALLGGMLSIPTWCPCLAFLVPLTDWGGWVAPMYFCTPSAPAFSALMLRGGKGSLGLGSPRPAPLSSLAQGIGQK